MEYLTNSEYLIQFGKNLRRVRKSKGYTQAELVNDMGIEISQISRIERGVINTSIITIYDISKVLNIEIIGLFMFLKKVDNFYFKSMWLVYLSKCTPVVKLLTSSTLLISLL